MRILHTADIHFGQNIYQNYERLDEHLHFFSQLSDIIKEYEPDVLVISGDIFDVAQPSAGVWSEFNDRIVELRRGFPSLSIVIVAGNHDSASRIESHSKVWDIAGVTVVGTPPPLLQSAPEGWEERFVVALPSGFVIALPYVSGDRADTMKHLQEYVASINENNLPVVMTGHLAAVGSDLTGHDPEIGNIRSVAVDRLGIGYDYLALGHIHMPQTLGKSTIYDEEPHSYPAPVARYSGSPLHVSENENYPHSVSVVDIDRHGGEVCIKQLRIDQLRHFITLPDYGTDAFASTKEATAYLKKFLKHNDRVYIRLRFSGNADIPSDFTSSVYSLIDKSRKDVRYNPRMIFISDEENSEKDIHPGRNEIRLEDLKQMKDPRIFVRNTSESYPGLTDEDLDRLFDEAEEEVRKMQEQGN